MFCLKNIKICLVSSLRAGGCFTMQDLVDNGFDEEIYVARLKPNKLYLAGLYIQLERKAYVFQKHIYNDYCVIK